jgi:hypothetical protein
MAYSGYFNRPLSRSADRHPGRPMPPPLPSFGAPTPSGASRATIDHLASLMGPPKMQTPSYSGYGYGDPTAYDSTRFDGQLESMAPPYDTYDASEYRVRRARSMFTSVG